MISAAVLGALLPAAFAPVPVIILAACLLLSLIVPGSAGRLALVIAIAGSAIVFVLWATSDATTCGAACSSFQKALTLTALAIGPGLVLLLVLVAAFRVGGEDPASDEAQGPNATEEAPVAGPPEEVDEAAAEPSSPGAASASSPSAA